MHQKQKRKDHAKEIIENYEQICYHIPWDHFTAGKEFVEKLDQVSLSHFSFPLNSVLAFQQNEFWKLISNCSKLTSTYWFSVYVEPKMFLKSVSREHSFSILSI